MAFPSKKKAGFKPPLLRSAGAKARTDKVCGRNYEHFTQDHRKRDGRVGVGSTLVTRGSYPDISNPLSGPRLHIVSGVLRDPRSYRQLANHVFPEVMINGCFRTS